ncbi:DUF305 domain-containing protein [Rubrobacter tropicus]|uniref:DUF305 domain-containing protein n=1 Tax=Rubrobacter tropicus TaxID=2653851 RepID=A0A6G8QE86_9ACTN|nr:DUF305 domain-containing protein [Rubrobacter tropicus]QIN84814.1 DUF305 domain-containing protein [Rubrobacter tropicus]
MQIKLHTRLAVVGLLSVLVLAAASCGGAGGSAKDDAGGSGAQESAKTNEVRNMGQGPDGDASGMLMQNGRYSDERFIDAMVPHHQGAVEMAEVGLENAEHEEIKQLSENIVSTQKAEIKDLKEIKQEEFGTSRIPTGMNSGQMENMGMMTDSGNLANEKPFDKAFIDNMIPHHQSAIEMAEVARDKSQNPRIEELATNIVEAQEREISQMKQWREQWYPGG